MDEKDKLNQNEIDNVSGGNFIGGGKVFGSGCKNYVCKHCGAPAVYWIYSGDTCVAVTVHHQPDCSLLSDQMYRQGTIKECCLNCKHSSGFMSCSAGGD